MPSATRKRTTAKSCTRTNRNMLSNIIDMSTAMHLLKIGWLVDLLGPPDTPYPAVITQPHQTIPRRRPIILTFL
jgi:hypothetical protein